MIDITNQIDAIHREVSRRQGADGEEVAVVIRRTYDAPNQDVWGALTEPERIKRWFYPVTGDLEVGGRFQTEGNADGEILRCEPPRLLKVTYGGPTSVVELRLAPEGEDRTMLELEHTVPIEIAQSGAGSLFVAPGWEAGFIALDLYLRGEIGDDPAAAATSPEGLEMSKQSVDSWVSVVRASGTATSDEIAAATQMALMQFAPDVVGTDADHADS